MRGLGIDPGSRGTGYGIIEKGGNHLQWVAYGEIKPPQHAALSICLKTICGKIANITEEEKPDAIAVEDIFYGKNVKSLIKQGHVRGAIILTCSQMGIPVFEYTPLEIKQAVVGYGRAEKSQVQTMVRAILKIPETIRADAADALAIAICHANFSKVSSL
jgi:crossover junction endodeoxyribonuclease RuvC